MLGIRKKTIQNQLIYIIGDEIRAAFINDIKECKLYSVMAYEVTDATNEEQVPLVIRYVNSQLKVREVFMDFFKHGTHNWEGIVTRYH